MLRTKGAPLGAMVPGGAATAGAGESPESTILLLLLGRACDDHLSVPDFQPGRRGLCLAVGSAGSSAGKTFWRGW